MAESRVQRIPSRGGRVERVLVKAPGGLPLPARFCELGTNSFRYLDLDSVYRHGYSEIGIERRSGYGYHGTWAALLVERERPCWLARRGLR